MSSGLDLRKRGTRRDPDASKKQRLSPLSAIDAGSPGEVRVSTDAMMALQHLYNSSPSIQAARTVIIGQLLSSGCVVRRGGRDVELKDTFSRHLEDVWLPFARAVIDHFMMFGFVVVSLEEEVGGSSGGGGACTPLTPLTSPHRRRPRLPTSSRARRWRRPVRWAPRASARGARSRSRRRRRARASRRPSTLTTATAAASAAAKAPTTAAPTSSHTSPTSASTKSRSSTSANLVTDANTGFLQRTLTRSTVRTTPPRSFFARLPILQATSARRSRPCFSRRRSSQRSKSLLSRLKSCARGR